MHRTRLSLPHPASAATEAIDYFIVGGATAKAEVFDSDVSDHLPVVAEVEREA